ncbi:MAG: hypothetical protein K0R31_615 [Clostridiales bacterium]|jgi:hypothetical protein|nr:hypothetical protein [Clostridiales bacterium]
MGGLPLVKKILYILLIVSFLTTACSCALIQKQIDNRTGFSNSLKQLEIYIRDEDWQKAKTSLENSNKIWIKLKPLLQIDIDHDFVYDMEENFVKMGGYIDTKEKGNSLTTILLLEDTWENIGSF